MSASDLPLLSLNSSFQVKHYQIKLLCHLERKIFSGVIQMFLLPMEKQANSTLILDTRDITIESVESVEATGTEFTNIASNSEGQKQLNGCLNWFAKPAQASLQFRVKEWSTEIFIHNSSCNVIRVLYQTKPEGKSILWSKDDEGNPCCLTAGSLINNRSLFPHQDAPNFMATWEMIIQVPKHYTVATTGDDFGLSTGEEKFYFYTQMVLPLSTFALAIGKWHWKMIKFNQQQSPNPQIHLQIKCHHQDFPCPFKKPDVGPGVPTRLLSINSVDLSIIVDFLPSCYEALYNILGRHLVPKLDIVILPKSVSYLGLTSPSLILLSPTVLYGSARMLERLSHEVSHSWFGVSIGPKNWEEEWISEGFSTFMEVGLIICEYISSCMNMFIFAQDVIDLKMSENSSVFQNHWLTLKALNRYEILKSDCENVDSRSEFASISSELHAVRNGLSADKLISQIPYLKGYFFLLRLSHIFGLESMLLTLRKYVEKFHGTPISTEECISFFCFEHEEHRTQINQVAREWLYSTQLVDHSFDDLKDNELYQEVLRHYNHWIVLLKRKARKKKRIMLSDFPTSARPDQLITLFDRLLVQDSPVPGCIIKQLIDTYQPHLVNANVYHRFCELTISNRYMPSLPLVRKFLLDHVAMGAYLYGELIISDIGEFKSLAHESYQKLEPFLEHDFRTLLQEILGLSSPKNTDTFS